MGDTEKRDAPFYFTKSHSAINTTGSIPYPSATADYQFELELVVALERGGHRVAPDGALALIYGYMVGLDMTRRDLQSAAKKKGLPWDTGKDVEGSCVLGHLHRAETFDATAKGTVIELLVNGMARQRGALEDMIWSVPEIIAHLSTLYVLEPGDLIMTGTPAGVGPVLPGDRLEGRVGEIELSVVVEDMT